MGRQKVHRPSLGTVLGALALMVSLGGVAYATIPGSGGTIEGCYDPSNAKPPFPLSVVDVPTDCASPAVLLPFNQTGPAGPAGVQGPAGPASASGADVYHTTVSSSQDHIVDFPGGGRFDLTLDVPPGTYSIVADASLRGLSDFCLSSYLCDTPGISDEVVKCLLAIGPNRNVIFVGPAGSDVYTAFADVGASSVFQTSVPATIAHVFTSAGTIHYECLDLTSGGIAPPGLDHPVHDIVVLTDTIVATRVLGAQHKEAPIVRPTNVEHAYPLNKHQISVLLDGSPKKPPKKPHK
jgi:hypothetical protein